MRRHAREWLRATGVSILGLRTAYDTGTADLTGVWRLRPGGQPERIAALPASGPPNGLALDDRTHTLYVTDSELGII